ncbi:MAG: DEAD/DEAH box helicase family protein [Pseudolactococcus laudensis]
MYRFFISVAFVTQSGLCFLKTHFADLARKGIRGRLMTSNYPGFNNPDVFRSLLEIENIDVRIVEKEGFHVKGYLFEQNGYHSLIIGSSNLTANALKKNIEWNVRLTSLENGEVLRESKKELERMWYEALPLTEKWVERYAKNWQSLTRDKLVTDVRDEKAVYSVARPNVMQEKALENLANLRSEGKNKGLVISATGTGKTYLSAFDVRQVNPSKILFIVHREQIIKSAIKTFKMVIGGPDEDFGILSGNSKDITAKYLFATIQTISKPQILSIQPFFREKILYRKERR